MRFTLASVFFLIAAFVFFILWAVSSFLLTSVSEGLDPIDDNLPSDYTDLRDLLSTAFGIICAFFFFAGVVLIFVVDSLADEPEYYWREQY